MGGRGLSDFFIKNPNLHDYFFLEGEGGAEMAGVVLRGGNVARVSESKSKKKTSIIILALVVTAILT